jgi:hypothetical protein
MLAAKRLGRIGRQQIPPCGMPGAFNTTTLSQTATRSRRSMNLPLHSPQTAPTTEELPKDVADLALAIGRLPVEHRSQLEPLLFRVVDSTRRRRRILNLVQEALSQLRLDMKYLVFDLEATRRERDALRQGPEHDELRGDH